MTLSDFRKRDFMKPALETSVGVIREHKGCQMNTQYILLSILFSKTNRINQMGWMRKPPPLSGGLYIASA